MKTRLSPARIPFTQLLVAILLFNCLVAGSITSRAQVPIRQARTAQDQNRVIVIKADQPNVWTLEQAHYLLAQMHRRNLDLKAKSLEDLDPNEIAGLRFEVMRTLIEFGATFNQADMESNRLLAGEQKFSTERRRSLIDRRDKLSDESLALSREISQLEINKAQAATQEEKDRLAAEISAKTTHRDKVDKQIESIEAQLATMPATSGQLKATEAEVAFDPEKLPKSIFDDAFKDAAAKQIERFNQEPRLNASLRLENFLQMQYEIIAKQLTLLRDEVGPGERLLFLELPQTVNVAHHEANKKWAQSWWKIAGYTVRKKDSSDSPESNKPETKKATTDSPTKTDKPQADIATSETQSEQNPSDRQNPKPITTQQDVRSILDISKPILIEEKEEKKEERSEMPKSAYRNTFINLDDIDLATVDPKLKAYLDDNKALLTDQTVRTVDLIPRQSSLNVNDMKLHVRAGAISLVGSFLFGFGARLNAQRQREQFSQFVQQELYSSAFGKGSREFGWTFTPMPGTDRLLSGVRTTYAVVVVPQEATSIILEANGCYFPRSAYQPNDFQDTKDSTRWGDSRTSRGCGTQSKLFIASIPSSTLEGTNDFWVDKISYQAVGKGKRIVVLVSGKNFSSQIGVLINGVPLIHSIGMAQPLIRDDSKAGNKTLEEFKEEKVRGRIERVDANKIVFSFEMGDDFNGTPTITLIAPGRAVDLNWLTNIHVNGERTSLDAYQKKMFGHGPGPQAFRIDSVEAFHSGNGNLRALIRGAGFIRPAPSATAAPPQRVLFINGSRQNHTAVSSSLIEVSDFQASDEVIRATLVYGDDTVVSQSVPNPTHLRVDKATIVSYEAVSGSSPAVLVVRIEGSGFSEALQTSVGELAVQSATEAILKIKDPDAAVIVTLTDPRTGTSVKTVVTRKTLANEY